MATFELPPVPRSVDPTPPSLRRGGLRKGLGSALGFLSSGPGMALAGTGLSLLAGRRKKSPRFRPQKSAHQRALESRASGLLSGSRTEPQVGILGEFRKRGREAIAGQRARMSGGGAARQTALLERDIARQAGEFSAANLREGSELASFLARQEAEEGLRAFGLEREESRLGQARADDISELFARIGGAGLEEITAGPAEAEQNALIAAAILGDLEPGDDPELREFLLDILGR